MNFEQQIEIRSDQSMVGGFPRHWCCYFFAISAAVNINWIFVVVVIVAIWYPDEIFLSLKTSRSATGSNHLWINMIKRSVEKKWPQGWKIFFLLCFPLSVSFVLIVVYKTPIELIEFLFAKSITNWKRQRSLTVHSCPNHIQSLIIFCFI